MLLLKCEPDNVKDKFAVAVMKSGPGAVVGATTTVRIAEISIWGNTFGTTKSVSSTVDVCFSELSVRWGSMVSRATADARCCGVT